MKDEKILDEEMLSEELGQVGGGFFDELVKKEM